MCVSGLFDYDGGINNATNELKNETVVFTIEGVGTFETTKGNTWADWIPWSKEHNVLIMAYSPLCHYKENRQEITCNFFIQNIADNENKTPESLMLSFVIRNRDIVTVFKTSDIKRLDNNMKNVFSPISEENNKTLSQFFKTPTKRTKLKTI